MKKFLILSTALIAGVSAASAAGTVTVNDGYSLTLEWEDASLLGKSFIRSGIGVNDKFFCVDFQNGYLKVWGKGGKVIDSRIPSTGYDLITSGDDTSNRKIWISCTADDAGNVIVRTDRYTSTALGWAGIGGVGNYDPANGSIAVIDSKELKILESKVAMTGGPAGRADLIGKVYGDIMSDEGASVFMPFKFSTNPLVEFKYGENNGTVCSYLGVETFPMTFSSDFVAAGDAVNQSTGMAQRFSETEMAVFGNPLNPVTSSDRGTLGNAIELYTLEDGKWTPTGKYFITPNHAAMGNFYVFSLASRMYIVYPSGQTIEGIPGDSFAISEIQKDSNGNYIMADSPKNQSSDSKVRIAYKAPEMNGTKFKYDNGGNFYGSFNVEPVEGDSNAVYIYAYQSHAPMSKWKFSTTVMPTGVESVELESEDAPVEYFNLQGMRVENPENGIFIRRQGNKVTKVIKD